MHEAIRCVGRTARDMSETALLMVCLAPIMTAGLTLLTANEICQQGKRLLGKTIGRNYRRIDLEEAMWIEEQGYATTLREKLALPHYERIH